MSKLFFICALLFCVCYQGFSQNRSFIGVELLGRGGFYSINYSHEFDSLKNGNFFTLRGGFSFVSFGGNNLSSSSDFFIPLSSHYTVGKHWEVGLGVTPYIRFKSFEDGTISEKTREFHVLSFASFGYRKNLGEKWLMKASISTFW
ncbi:unnamed protein product, partial [Ectocarpus fasciculatus]